MEPKRVVELNKEGKRILVTLWDNNKVVSCLTDETEKRCQSCDCDDESCQEWINHLKEQGYSATEIELGELGDKESLPRFLQERESQAQVEPEAEVESDSDGQGKENTSRPG